MDASVDLDTDQDRRFVEGEPEWEVAARDAAVLHRIRTESADYEGDRARHVRLVAPDRPELWVVLDEAVLRRPIGGHAVMQAQLQRLLDAEHELLSVDAAAWAVFIVQVKVGQYRF